MNEIKKIYHQLNEEFKAAENDIETFRARQSDHQGKVSALGAQLAQAEQDQADLVRRHLAGGAKETEVFRGQETIDRLSSQMRSMEQISAAMKAQITELQARRDELNGRLVRDRQKYFAKISKQEFAKVAETLARAYAAYNKAHGGRMEFGNYAREATQDYRQFFSDVALKAIADQIRAEYKM